MGEGGVDQNEGDGEIDYGGGGDGDAHGDFQAVDGETSMRRIFEQLEIETSFEIVNDVRLKLTTSAFPYLRAVPHAAKKDSAAVEERSGERESMQESNYRKFKRIKPRTFTV